MIEISKVKTTIPSFLLDRLLQTGMEPVQADVISGTFHATEHRKFVITVEILITNYPSRAPDLFQYI